jgi:glycopeptide antibiotics resistance protein
MKQSFLVRNAPSILVIFIGLFLFCALGLGEMLKVYDLVWWWDDMLHGMSGIILGFAGLFTLYFLNGRTTEAMKPLFVAIFVFMFAISLGVIWEIYEFFVDIIFGTAMQQWNMPPNAIVGGRSFQGMGLRDTMDDLILASIGAIIAAMFCYVGFKNKKSTVIAILQNAFPRKD